MKKNCMKCLCLLLAACLLLGMAALAEDAGAAVTEPESSVIEAEDVLVEPEDMFTEPEDVLIVAEAADAAVAEGEADLDATAEDDADAPVPEEEFDLDAAYDEEPADPEVWDDPQATLSTTGIVMDNDTLFAGYVDRLFGVGTAPLFEARNVGGDLTGASLTLYDGLKRFVKEVAAGERASTVYTCDDEGLSRADIYNVINCLIADCPYELYWFSSNYNTLHWSSQDQRTLTLSFYVSSGYADGDFSVDTATVSRAQTAAANARTIVDRYAASADFDKLAGYRDAICDATSYNYDAANGRLPANDYDPWQLIWVFDGDPLTKVVCEGYAKAFQYLCDMTTFSGSVTCYCVTGYMNSGSHKWNIVRMPNGKNYLADITQCDAEESGTYDWIFMKSPNAGGSVSSGYGFTVNNGNQTMSCQYRYDADTVRLYGTAGLTLSPSGYAEDAGLSGGGFVNDDQDNGLSIGDGPDASQSTAQDLPSSTDTGSSSGSDTGAGTAASGVEVIPMSGNASRTVSVGAAYQIELGGPTGTKFRSSNVKVVRVSGSGLVTPRKAGRAKITFRVGRKKRTLSLKVVDPTVPSWVSLNPSGTVAVQKGGKVALTAEIPAGTNSGFTWKSSNRRVASVNKNGLVTFKKPGRATITATAKRGKKKAKVTFVVGK